MKNILTLFLFLLIIPVTAQEYVPMLETGKTWNMFRANDTGGGYSYNIEITETVEINELTYFRIESLDNCEILLREDVLNKKVYRLINDQDVLLFDFSLGVGDLAPENFPISPFPFPLFIDEVGISDFFNILDLKFYGFDFYSIKLIESIGFSNNGIINCFDEGCQAIGIFEWDILMGMNEILSNGDFFRNNNIGLFYNSNTKQLQVINSTEKLHINLYSVLGNKVIDSYVQFKMDISHLTPGIYIYKLSKNNSVKTGKILVY